MGIFFLIFAALALTASTLVLPERVIKTIHIITFSFAWLGIYFLYLAIKLSKGDLYKFSTHVISGLTGAIITLYLTGSYYNIIWDEELKMWMMQFHPALMMLLFVLMVAIIYELVSFSKRLFLTSRNIKVKNNLRLFFIGWIITGLSSVALVLSVLFEFIPTYSFLIFVLIGFLFISLSIVRFPSSLIASPIKIYAVGFLEAISGNLLHIYDFTKLNRINRPELFSGLMIAVNTCLQQSIVGCRYLKTMDVGPRKIIIARGFYVQAVMITERYTSQLEKILNRLLILFEIQFYNQLKNFDGDVTFFPNFNKIIEKYMAFAL
ncbi:MAG: hypothetical protein ACFFD5_10280 [Candidatus Thorarchaeota archaeon]